MEMTPEDNKVQADHVEQLDPVISREIPYDEVQTWPGYVAMEAAAEARDQFKKDLTDVTLAAPSALGRWAVRLGLPTGFACLALQIPHTSTIDGISMRIEGSLFSRPGFSADTTLGNWEFRQVDGLPIGVHVSPQNVNGLEVAKQANPDVKAYTEKLRRDVKAEIPMIATILGAEVLGGVAVGAGVGALINNTMRQRRGFAPREHELRYRGKQALALTAATAAITAYGAASWNPAWIKDSHLTGTLAEAQGFNGNLSQFYNQQSKAYEVTQAILAIQSSLQEKLDANAEPTAFNVMYISDMHMGTDYPMVAKYAEAYGVKLIVNTGDESNFGTRAEMRPEYVASIKELTKEIPMIWVAGNHDSPETLAVMGGLPGVKVLGTKELQPDGSFKVGAQKVNVYGLNVGAIPDPRVYGGGGESGSNDGPITQKLETNAVDAALKNAVLQNEYFDMFMTHEPVAAAEIARLLLGHVRQLNTGHLHQQNKASDIQKNGIINLVEGSTSGGGLESTGKNDPKEFTIASIASDCQETKLLRFRLNPGTDVSAAGSTTVDTIYLKPQKLEAGRVCSTDQGIGPVRDIIPGIETTVQAAGK